MIYYILKLVCVYIPIYYIVNLYYKNKSIENYKNEFYQLIEQSKIEITLGPLNWTDQRFPQMDKPLVMHWLKNDDDSMYNLLILHYWFKHLISDPNENILIKNILLGCIARTSKYALHNEYCGWTISKLIQLKHLKGKVFVMTAKPSDGDDATKYDGHKTILFIDENFGNKFIIDVHEQQVYVNNNNDNNMEKIFKRIIFDGNSEKNISIEIEFITNLPIAKETQTLLAIKLNSLRSYLNDFQIPIYTQRFDATFTKKIFLKFKHYLKRHHHHHHYHQLNRIHSR